MDLPICSVFGLLRAICVGSHTVTFEPFQAYSMSVLGCHKLDMQVRVEVAPADQSCRVSVCADIDTGRA